jgi:four helix bundle protein
MQDFLKLRVIAQARVVLRLAYKVTDTFPATERFVVVPQMRRAAWGIGSNIAEGCGRSSLPAYRVALDRAMGEASELRFQCIGARDLELGDRSLVEQLQVETERLMRMLAKLIVSVRGRAASHASGNNEGLTRQRNQKTRPRPRGS